MKTRCWKLGLTGDFGPKRESWNLCKWLMRSYGSNKEMLWGHVVKLVSAYAHEDFKLKRGLQTFCLKDQRDLEDSQKSCPNEMDLCPTEKGLQPPATSPTLISVSEARKFASPMATSFRLAQHLKGVCCESAYSTKKSFKCRCR